MIHLSSFHNRKRHSLCYVGPFFPAHYLTPKSIKNVLGVMRLIRRFFDMISFNLVVFGDFKNLIAEVVSVR